MTAPVLADVLGPKARRRVALASVVATVVIGALVVLAVKRLADRGQLDAELWRPFTEWPVLRFLLGGLGNTVKAALVSMVLAMSIGAMLALGRLSRAAPLRWLSGTYVEFFRAVPLLLLIYFAARGLPRYDVELSLFWYLVIGLVAYNSAVLGEIFRAGILSLERGQTEAAYALGMSYWQTMRTVIVPQAARRMIPSIVSQLITLLKDTSLGFVIPYEELLRRARINGEFNQNLLQSYFVVAVVYMVVNFGLSRVARRLEVRQRRRFRAGALSVGGAEDLTAVEVAAEPAARRS